MNDKIDEIEKHSKVNLETQSALIRFLARLDIDTRLLVFKQHRKILFMFRDMRIDGSIEMFSYVAFLLAVKQVYADQQKIKSLNFEGMTLDEIRDLSIQKAELFLNKKFTRNKPKREQLLRHWGTIKVLREKGLSFRDISLYLDKNNKLNIAHSTIYALWNELEQEHSNG
jgi:hypothetical protein